MGVLDINDRLKHRIRLTDEVLEDPTWEGSEEPNEPPSDEAPEPVRSPRQRKSKLRPKYFVNASSRRPKGSRSGRRYENTCFLLSLVDHEEIQDLELSDIVNQTMTIFSTLFDDPQKMKIWNDYANLPEEEQYRFIHSQTEAREVASTTSATLTEEKRKNTNEKMYANADKAYLNIDKKIRGTFQRKRFPLGGLENLEKDVLTCLSDLPDAVMVSILPSSLDRMMVHAICQYLKLACQSHDCNGTRLMEIENHRNTFELPRLLLSQYLRKKYPS